MEPDMRPMRIDDYEDVLRLWKICLKEAFRKIHHHDTKKALAKTLERNPESCLVALSRGKIIGSILGTYDFRFGYLYRFAIDPEFRGKGIGIELMKKAERALKKQGARKIIFYCLERKGLISYYEKLGYKKAKSCLMRKELK